MKNLVHRGSVLVLGLLVLVPTPNKAVKRGDERPHMREIMGRFREAKVAELDEILQTLQQASREITVRQRGRRHPGEQLIMLAELGNIREMGKIFNKDFVNYQNAQGKTALMSAVEKGHDHIVKFLLDNGANPDLQNKVGATALMFAALYGRFEILNILIQKRANLNLQNRIGMTALMYASFGRHKNIVDALIASGANPTLKDRYGKDALGYAETPEIQDAIAAAIARFSGEEKPRQEKFKRALEFWREQEKK